jgi:hypothetical protein
MYGFGEMTAEHDFFGICTDLHTFDSDPCGRNTWIISLPNIFTESSGSTVSSAIKISVPSLFDTSKKILQMVKNTKKMENTSKLPFVSEFVGEYSLYIVVAYSYSILTRNRAYIHLIVTFEEVLENCVYFCI